jgi:hypothetical protein
VFNSPGKKRFLRETFPWIARYIASHYGVKALGARLKDVGWNEDGDDWAHYDIKIYVNKNQLILLQMKPSGEVLVNNPQRDEDYLNFDFLYIDSKSQPIFHHEKIFINILHCLATNYGLCFPAKGVKRDVTRFNELVGAAFKDPATHYGDIPCPSAIGLKYNAGVSELVARFGKWMLTYLATYNGFVKDISRMGFTDLCGDCFVLTRSDEAAFLKSGIVLQFNVDGNVIIYDPNDAGMTKFNSISGICSESQFVNTLNLVFMFPDEYFNRSTDFGRFKQYAMLSQQGMSSNEANYGPIRPQPTRKSGR